jgi:hypothetical protein
METAGGPRTTRPLLSLATERYSKHRDCCRENRKLLQRLAITDYPYTFCTYYTGKLKGAA